MTEATQPTTVAGVGDAEFRSLWNTAHAIAASGVYREIFTAEEAFARILAGRDLGLSPTDAIKHMHLIDGEFTPSAEIQLALLKRYVGPDGERYLHKIVTPRAKRHRECFIEIYRRDQGGEWVKLGKDGFTLEDAERQELGGDFWDRMPSKMLFWRAVTNAIDTFAPEVLHPERTAAPDESDVPVEDGPALPVAGDLLDGVRVDDPTGIRRPQWQLLGRIHDELQERGQEQRFIDALDAVGAPAHEEIVQRYMQLNENQAAELVIRLDRPRLDRRRRRQAGNGNVG